jgi:hypothetical protein
MGGFTTGGFTTVDTFDLDKTTHIVSTDSQQVLITEKTDLNGSVKNSRNLGRRDALNSLADQIANLCQVNIDLASAKTRDSLKTVTLALYDKGVTSQELKKFKTWWYNEYWAGKKGQPPTPGQIGDTYGQFEGSNTTVPAAGPVLTEAEKQRLAELTAQFNK